MAARSIGTLTISFGLVSIPVKLYSATESGKSISFNMLHKGCGSRLLQRALAHDLHCEVDLTFGSQGVRCEIRCRLEDAGPRPEPQFAGFPPPKQARS